jgi:hypothetical protein
MKKLFLCLISCVLSVPLTFGQLVWADERDEEIGVLKTQVQELLKRIEVLEQDQAKTKQAVATGAGQSRVDLSNAVSKLKMKGRWAAGYYSSQQDGSYPNGSFQAPEAKIQFAFEPDKFNTIVMRLNLNNATFNNLDYFYLDSKDFLPFLKDKPFTLNSRLGRFKMDIGEETWSNNSVDSVLPSNSAANVGGNDEGWQLSGKIGKKNPLNWSAGIFNGNSGTGADNGEAKGAVSKISWTPIKPLYVSASYAATNRLKTADSEISIAGSTSRPTGATNWDRSLWEVDARYDFKKGTKKLDPPAFSDSKAYVKLAYGEFKDDTSDVTDRKGDYGFVEGAYNFTPKLYGALRYSMIDLNGLTTASLNSVTANEYQRYSIGGGYRFSENTIFKVSYDINEEKCSTDNDAPDNNLISAIVASQF